MADKRELAQNAIDKVLSRLEADESASAYLNSSGAIDPKVEAALDAEIKQEIALEKKFGDSPVEAAAGSALSTATLGLSDQALVGLGVSPERLSETRERSPVASGIGVGAGIIVPAIASAGESLVARGVQAAATPLEAASTLGKLATRGAEKLVEGRIRSNALKEILKSAAGNAAEGATLSVGNLVSENALGRADLNAQNIVASAGAGAMLGAGFGTSLGAAKAAAPLIRKGIAPITEKLSNAAKNALDPKQAAAELVGITPLKMAKIEEFKPNFSTELPVYLVEKLELKPLTTADELIAANSRVKASAGLKIGEISDRLDKITAKTPNVMPPRMVLYDRLLQKLKPIEERLNVSPSVNKAELDVLKNFKRDIQKKIDIGDPSKQSLRTFNPNSSFRELDDLRKLYQGVKFKGGGAVESFKANVADRLRSELRAIVDETAERVSELGIAPATKALAQELKVANKDFGTASTLERYLPKKLNGKALVGMQDIIEGAVITGATHSGPLGAMVALGRRLGRSDLRRKAVVLADIKSQGMAISKSIKDAVGAFTKRAGKPLRQLSQKSLLNSGFAVDYETKEPAKNKQAAFAAVAKNLAAIAQDQDLMIERLAKSTARFASVAPAIAQETQNTLVRSVQFLESKLPQAPSSPAATLFAREYNPSGIEMAKFERYMQAVEHPMSVLEDLEAGTLTREHVEALQVVYPSLYEQIRQEVLEQAVQPDSGLSYNKKLQLGILLNIPTDPSLEPANIAGLQGSFMPQNDPMQVEAQQGAIRQGNQTGLQKLNVASRAQTDVQAVQSRKQS